MEWTVQLPPDAEPGQDHLDNHDKLRDAINELRSVIEAMQAGA